MRTRIAGIAVVFALGAALIFVGREVFSGRHVGLKPAIPASVDEELSHAHSPSATSNVTAVALPPSQEELWSRPAAEPAFARFKDWTKRHAAATPQGRAALEDEGVALARARLAAMADRIRSNPQRALELAVPLVVRERMPASVRALLEERVSATGDYSVVCVTPLPGQKSEHPFIRSAVIAGTVHQVFTYDAGLDYVTRRNVPLNGIAVPVSAAANLPPDLIGLHPGKLMALSPSPARLLDETERATRAPGAVVAVEWAGHAHAFPDLAAAQLWAASQTAGSDLDSPQPPGESPTAESPYTEGRKRYLLMRVNFPDYTNDVFPTNSALQHMTDMSNFLGQISYYKHVIAPVGKGSDITPIMLMGENASAYDNAGLSKLYPEARTVAQNVHGYDLTQYDFFFVCTGGRPSYSYAGLGYVGGVGYHLANGYFDVRTSAHELGHNLGLSHANWWETGGDSIIGAGSNEEYGDPFDTMGSSGGGSRHFSASQKYRIDWIPASDAPTVTASGVFRLHAHDIATAPVGVRALRFNRASGDPYWAEFRQLWTGNKALMNGINFRRAAGSSQLLDMNPGSSAGKDDHSLVIGRTFSDTSLGLHVTPTGKGHTYPESIDVVVNIGTFPANLPPVCVVNAGSLTASVGQSVSFTATATDPNGDTLAYFWDFDDDDYSIDNSAVATHSFTAAGEYTVQCAVSDMKGGVGRDSIIIRVGSPTTFRISGRVFNAQNRPLPGIRVSADATHYAMSDSDGAYTITALAAGNYTLDAREPVTDTTSFSHPFFANPVTVGPSATNQDFIVGTPVSPYSLVAVGSTWKYLDNGTDQGTAWAATNFNDAAWASGSAQLGYGDGDEATTVGYGPNASAKYTTTYFRRAFTVANPTLYSNLSVNVLRDDGAIVHLNGVEIFRNNMPAGAVNYATFATASVDSQNYVSAAVNASLIRTGTNVFAVEIHQSDLSSSDISFDLSLTADTNVTQTHFVYLTGPEPGAVFAAPTNLTLSANALITVGSFTNVEFFDGAVKFGEDNAAPYNFVLINPSFGAHTLSAVAVTSGGIRRTSPPVAITVAQPAAPPVALTLVPPGATWRYMASASAPAATWPALSFNDSAWPSGPAELGFGDGGEPTVINGGPAANRYPTIYFRHAFTVNDPAAITSLALQLKRDDGAVVYLNGAEVLRDNMPAGAIAYTTLATASATDDGATFLGISLEPALLRHGTNVLAVEVHQSALDSSDLSFDLSLTALASTNRARGCWLVSPAEGATLAPPIGGTLAAQAVAGGSLGLARMDYYSDGVLIGASTNSSFTLAWPNPPGGAHVLTAVATDSAGGSVTSAPVNITVLAPPLATALISFGDVWNYMDDGSNQGTNWTGRLFNDAAWAAGPARLGYGGDGEVTTVSFGTNAALKHLTTYFRRRFTVANPAALNSLLLRLTRDDGAVVYLNGVEKYRNNLEDGLVSWNSLAVAAIDAPSETTPVDVSLTTAGLVAGTNVLAVEIHQASIGSSDLGFNLALTGLTSTNTTNGIYLASPANGARYLVPASVALSAFAAAPAPITLVEYFAGANKIAQATAQPYDATWANPPVGVHALTARATYGAGLVLTSPPISIVVGPAPQPSQPVFLTLVPPGAGWNYWDSASAPGTGWQSPLFNDAAWPSGTARFGWGLDGETTLLTEGRITHYFRRWFYVTNIGQLDELLLQLVRDDGAVVYLNGTEILRSNMPVGPVDAATLATASVGTPDETTWFPTVLATTGSGLTGGSNLVAVELHQSSASSSDASFDFALYGQGTTAGRISLVNPANNASFVNISGVPMEALASAGAGLSVSKVEFFADGSKIGESTVSPYRFTWFGAAFGPHVLMARLTDNLGGTLDSAPVTVIVTRELIATTFIPSNSVWKYFDGGVSQGTNWVGLNFNDSTWTSGPARLGFGDDGEVTLINGGPSNARFPTTYFRKSFIVPTGAIYTNLLFKLSRDDGAVIHLNGREAYRNNMPATAIIYATLSSTSATDEQSFFPTNIIITNLTAGTNIVAVEVHQTSAGSGDLGFNLELTASGYIDESVRPAVAIVEMDGLIEISWSATYSTWRLYSSTDMLLPIAQWTPVAATPVTAGGRIVVSVPPAGFTRFFRLGRP